MAYLPQQVLPNILGDVNAGVDRGNQMNFNRLAGQYISDPSNNSMLLGQAAQIDPVTALKLQNSVEQQQASQQATQQTQQNAQLQKIGGAARYMASALQSNNPAQVDGAWQNVRPFLEQLTGKQTPPTWDPSMEPALYDVIAKTSQAFPSDLTPQKPISVGPDQTLIDPRTHQVIYQGAGDAGTAVQGMTYNGMPVFRDKQGNLKDVRGNPIPQGAQSPQGSQGLPSSLPAETQAYVPKVMGALNGRPAFDPFGQPTKELLDAVQHVESNGNPNAVSPAGAQGPYQFMPSTAASLGVNDPFDPTQARAGAAQYLAQLYQQFGGDAQKAIAAYNAGPGRVSEAVGGTPPSGGLQFNGGKGSSQNIVEKRQQDIAEFQKAGQPLTPEQQQAYLYTGKVPTDTDAPLSPQQEVMAQQIANYHLPVSAYSMSKPAMQALVARASQINPDYDSKNFEAAQALYKGMAGSSPTSYGGQLTAAAAALGHLNEMADISAKLPSHPSWVNAVENSGSSLLNTGDAPSLTDWNTGKNFVAGELQKMVKGGVASEGEVNSMLQNLSPNNPNRNEALATAAAFLTQKIQGIESTRDKVLGSASPHTSLLNAQQQAYAKRVMGLSQNYAEPVFAAPGNGPMVPGMQLPQGQMSGFGMPPQVGATGAGATSPIDALISKYGVK